MSERQRSESFSTGPESFSDEFAGGTATAERQIEVIHGVYAHSLPFAGMSVASVRAELAERMNIDPEAQAVVDGNFVPEDTILTEGNTLNFIKAAGERGR
jgi:hypothetical protein